MSVQDFIDAVLRSGLLGAAELRAALTAAPPTVAAEPDAVAGHLVERGLLTRFQAGKLRRGITAGLVFGPFRVLDILGSGAVGNVYLVVDSRTGRHCALKVLPPARAADDQSAARWRFRREMALAPLLAHQHIAACREIGRQDAIYFIVFDYLPGHDLETLIHRHGALPPARAARILAGAAAGLAHAHARGVIHRDLAPGNIMVSPDDHAWVCDFGMGLLRAEATAPGPRPAEPAAAARLLGTAGYIAPEQYRDCDAVTERVDIFSLGCCLYLALAGRDLFPGESSTERSARQLAEPAPVLSLDGVPGELLSLLHDMLSIEPGSRPDAAAVQARLLPFADA